ncbi:MAG TPA: glycoside hydrolase domain-containing protein, partial [Minicystis sp.]|nr:glycoside hydrolase domain-containing protein [Minicystis sp.]
SQSGSGGGGTGGSGQGAGKVCTDCTPTGPETFALPSPSTATLWTTTTMDKVLRESAPPKATGAAVEISAAKNEFEPFQIAVHATADGTATLSLSPFSGPSKAVTRVEVRRVEYVHVAQPSDPGSIPSSWIPDPLEPSSFGKAEPVTGGQNQPFWITVYVPPNAAAGDYTATLTVTVNGQKSNVPVKLHVYDFALPAAIGFDGNWNGDFNALGGGQSLDVVKRLKTFFFEHRLTPSGVAWPAGLNYDGGIEYDCNSGTINDHQGGGYGLDVLGPEYIDGKGWNGVGFPSFEVMQFVDNSTPRPQTFCGVDRGPDAYGTPAYNAAWSKLLAAVDKYEVAKGWTKKGYYYVQNEPQGPADYDIAAFLANLTKTAAPHLRIAISEEPKPEIAENAKAMGHSYDLWWADLSAFDPSYAKVRQAAGDTVWWYFLYGDLPPHFNPITIDHAGIESRIPFWAAWKYRIKGFAYYSLTGWGSDPYGDPRPQGTNQNGDGFLLYPPKSGQLVTSIRWELLREGAEDYEYLLLAAGGKAPATPDTAAGCDVSVDSAVSSTTAFTRDTSAFKHLRDELGAMLEGKVDGCPKLDSKLPGSHKRAAYYINFQDPKGEPSASPLVVNGHTWTKIGWEAYDPKKGYGWAGPYIGDDTIMLYQYQSDAPGDPLQKSIIYDDYGRTDTFNWDIENGTYKVTVGIGWDNGNYPKNEVVVEGQTLFDNAVIDASHPYLEKSIVVDVSDGNVTMEVGQFNEYTMLEYMMIEPN